MHEAEGVVCMRRRESTMNVDAVSLGQLALFHACRSLAQTTPSP